MTPYDQLSPSEFTIAVRQHVEDVRCCIDLIRRFLVLQRGWIASTRPSAV